RSKRDWSSDVCSSDLERPADFRHLSTWLGHQDLLHLMERCILAEKADFTVIWGVSANTRSYWANTLAAHIGYSPQQNSEDYAVRSEERRVGKECRSAS